MYSFVLRGADTVSQQDLNDDGPRVRIRAAASMQPILLPTAVSNAQVCVRLR
jgi:hypothetical protein